LQRFPQKSELRLAFFIAAGNRRATLELCDQWMLVSHGATLGRAKLALEIKLSTSLVMDIKACHDARPFI